MCSKFFQIEHKGTYIFPFVKYIVYFCIIYVPNT